MCKSNTLTHLILIIDQQWARHLIFKLGYLSLNLSIITQFIHSAPSSTLHMFTLKNATKYKRASVLNYVLGHDYGRTGQKQLRYSKTGGLVKRPTGFGTESGV